jgi:hypothetical protein
MANICEPLINVVMENKPKVLGSPQRQPNPERVHRLGPKGKGSGMGAHPMRSIGTHPSQMLNPRRRGGT